MLSLLSLILEALWQSYSLCACTDRPAITTGLVAHSSQILPSALTVSERAHVGALGSAAWQEELQTAWNGDLLVFTTPQAEAGDNNAYRPHAELQLVHLAGLLR